MLQVTFLFLFFQDIAQVTGLIKTLSGIKVYGIKNVQVHLSSTSMPQQWHVPRGEQITPVAIKHVVIAKETKTGPLSSEC